MGCRLSIPPPAKGIFFQEGVPIRPSGSRPEVRCPVVRLLLVVEDSFAIAGRGLVVAPFLLATEAKMGRFAVELRRPDGSTSRVEAFAQIPRIVPLPKVLRAHLALLGVTKDDVPVGSEVWALE